MEGTTGMVDGGGDGNRSRKRMKHELETLRVTVTEMESELARLRLPSQDPSVARQLVEAAWADIAERQRALRYKAEVENTKLRALVEDRLRLCKQLERLIHKRQHLNVDWAFTRRARFSGISTDSAALENPRVVAMMKASMPQLLAQADGIFNRIVSMSDNNDPFRSIDLRTSEQDGMYVEALQRRVMPFDTATLSDATIEQFASQARRCDNPAVDGDGYTTYDASSIIDTDRYRGSIHSKIVLQRVDAATHTVIVFTALTDTSDIANAAADNLFVRHDGWCRVRERAVDETGSGVTVGEVVTYVLGYPETFNPSSDYRRKIGTTINFILASIAFQMDTANEIMDNFLLDRSCRASVAIS